MLACAVGADWIGWHAAAAAARQTNGSLEKEKEEGVRNLHAQGWEGDGGGSTGGG